MAKPAIFAPKERSEFVNNSARYAGNCKKMQERAVFNTKNYDYAKQNGNLTMPNPVQR